MVAAAGTAGLLMRDLCWAFTTIRNEADMLPFWLRHYGQFCARMVVFDDASTDGSAAIARLFGADVREYPAADMLDDWTMAVHASTAYREARGWADWVIWADADELIYAPDLPTKLRDLRARGVDMPRVQGYQMFGSHFPHCGSAQLYEYVTRGVPDNSYSKQVVFDPQLSVQFGVGRHSTAPVEMVTTSTRPEDELKLLHFRWFGLEYFAKRNARNDARRSARARQNGWGMHVEPGFSGPNDASEMAANAGLAQIVT